MILTILILALVAVSIPIAIWQLRQLLAAKREYRGRLAAQPLHSRAWQYAAVDLEVVRKHPRAPIHKDFPRPSQFAELSATAQALYEQGLRERELVARASVTMLSLVGAAVVAILVENLLQSTWSGLRTWADQGFRASQAGLAQASLWLFVVVVSVVVVSLSQVWLRLSVSNASRQLEAYRKTVEASLRNSPNPHQQAQPPSRRTRRRVRPQLPRMRQRSRARSRG